MRLHLLALPHTQVTEEYLCCAFTQKVLRFCRMMHGHHDVILYAGEHSEAPVVEHVQIHTERWRMQKFGAFDPVANPNTWDENDPAWVAHNKRTNIALKARVQEGDLILLTSPSQIPALKGIRNIAVEWAVGYEGVRHPYAIFESYAWMHHLYGMNGWGNGRCFDAVVPSFFSTGDFYTAEPQEYLLYCGRLIARKGVHVAANIAERAGIKLIVAGPGMQSIGPNRIVTTDGTVIESKAGLAYAGIVDSQDRAGLMAHATALLVPTQYIEPFGAVCVEAMLSGCPVIATDWGSFPEIVPPAVGYRFRTLREGVAAVDQALTKPLNRKAIRRHAVQRYSLDAVRPRYTEAFERLDTLHREGWYE